MVVKSKKNSQKGGAKRGRDETPSPEPPALALAAEAARERKRLRAKSVPVPTLRAAQQVLPGRPLTAPPMVSLEKVAIDVNLALQGHPENLIATYRESMERSLSPDFSPSPSPGPPDLGPDLSTLAAMEPLLRYEKMKTFLRTTGSVLLGVAYVAGDEAMAILGQAIEKGGVALRIVAQYVSEFLRPHAVALDTWAQGTAAIATKPISNLDEFAAVAGRWRKHLGKLPEKGTVLRFVRAYGWGVLSRVGSFGSIVISHLFSLLYKVLHYLFTAPAGINYAATASFIFEIASLCLEYITGGLIAVGPGDNTIAQLIIFLMTVLALVDKLIPHLESAYDQAIYLLIRLLFYLDEKTGDVGDFIYTSVIPFLQRGYESSKPLIELFQKATGLIFEGGVFTITFTQFLTQVLTEFARKTPEYRERLTRILRQLEDRGRGAGGGTKSQGGKGRIRKSRKSSSKKGKSGKKGGAKVKTAKRSQPCKKSKGKKAKKSKKN